MNGILKRYLSADGAVVCSVLDGTEMIAALERTHHPSAVVTAALGRLSMAASLIGYDLKTGTAQKKTYNLTDIFDISENGNPEWT